MGAHREGRSLWVWMVPPATAVVTFVLIAFLAHPGQIDTAARLSVAVVGALFMGGMSASYLAGAPEDLEVETPPVGAPEPPFRRPPGPRGGPVATGDERREVASASPTARREWWAYRRRA